ncbi:hypothetical protein [Streptomyces sp. KHY 26]|uniref:hypothetical protein n=1 Tax=Streptomyces sp. KHY 26 TaxID=3097359 RepID=UPI00376EE25F
MTLLTPDPCRPGRSRRRAGADRAEHPGRAAAVAVATTPHVAGDGTALGALAAVAGPGVPTTTALPGVGNVVTVVAAQPAGLAAASGRPAVP